MPTYVYKFVDTGETIEVQQAFTDDALTEAPHPQSGAVLPVKKVFTPVGVTFRGGGFYKTDSRGKPSSATSSAGGGSESSSGDSSSTPSNGSSGESKGDTKSSPSGDPPKPPSTPSAPAPSSTKPSASSSTSS